MDGRVRPGDEKLRNIGIVALVAVAHLVVLNAIGSFQAAVGMLPPAVPPLVVELMRPPEPPTPLRPVADRSPRGGASPSASKIHMPPPPLDTPPELIAPVAPAPAPGPMIGPSDAPSVVVGDEGGAGAGFGAGPGAGPGAGTSAGVVRPARWLRRATAAQVLEAYPAAALRANRSGHATLRCDILLNRRLTGCRVLAASPAGEGFNTAALAVSRHFRFEPATLDGRPLDREEIIIEVQFDPMPARKRDGT